MKANVQVFDSVSGNVLDQWIAPYRGKYRQPLEDGGRPANLPCALGRAGMLRLRRRH